MGEEKDILKEIRKGMEDKDQEEVVVKVVKELKKSSAKSVRSSEWSMSYGEWPAVLQRQDLHSQT